MSKSLRRIRARHYVPWLGVNRHPLKENCGEYLNSGEIEKINSGNTVRKNKFGRDPAVSGDAFDIAVRAI